MTSSSKRASVQSGLEVPNCIDSSAIKSKSFWVQAFLDHRLGGLASRTTAPLVSFKMSSENLLTKSSSFVLSEL
jgi:hypothetical protein